MVENNKSQQSSVIVRKTTVTESNENTVTNSVKSAKQTSQPKKVKKEPRKRKSLGKIFKEVVSELKKVSWASFPKVVKQTGVVITVVVVFTLILFGIDRLLSLLYTLLINGVV